MTLITDQQSLDAFCARMRGERFVAMDTEFMRDRTYYPKLCLVQVAGAERGGGDRPPGAGPGPRAAPGRARRPGRAQGHARRAPGPGDLLPSGPAAGTVLRHPGRGHGLRLRRGGGLRHAGEQARRRPARQELALHRLGAPAAVRGADPLRAGRRHPSAGDLREARRPDREGRPDGLGRRGAAGPARPQALQPAARGGLAPAQAAHPRRRASSPSSRRWPPGASARRSAATCRAPGSSATTC